MSVKASLKGVQGLKVDKAIFSFPLLPALLVMTRDAFSAKSFQFCPYLIYGLLLVFLIQDVIEDHKSVLFVILGNLFGVKTVQIERSGVPLCVVLNFGELKDYLLLHFLDLL